MLPRDHQVLCVYTKTTKTGHPWKCDEYCYIVSPMSGDPRKKYVKECMKGTVDM